MMKGSPVTWTFTLTREQHSIVETALYAYQQETETNIGEWKARFSDEPGLAEDLEYETELLRQIETVIAIFGTSPID
jgi:hypothetical protein